jgi:hypothetical protein
MRSAQERRQISTFDAITGTVGLGPVGTEDEFNCPRMPSTTPCVHCGIVGNVRWERVLRGTVMFVEYYCGRCEHVWRVDNDERLITREVTQTEKPERSRAGALADYYGPPRTERWQ